MSSSSIRRKLLPAKHAWKKLATTLQSKLFRLKRSKTFERTATRLNRAISIILSRRRRLPPSRLRLKRRSLTRLPSYPGRNRKKLHHHHRSFSPVYVDELLSKPSAPEHIEVSESAASVDRIKINKAIATGTVAGAEWGSSSQTNKAVEPPVAEGRAVVNVDKTAPSGLMTRRNTQIEPSSFAGMDLLEGVDLKAELFIAKFKGEMRIQRQKSLEDYQEMLARGL